MEMPSVFCFVDTVIIDNFLRERIEDMYVWLVYIVVGCGCILLNEQNKFGKLICVFEIGRGSWFGRCALHYAGESDGRVVNAN